MGTEHGCMRSRCPTPACRRHDAPRAAARRASSATRSSCCCAAPLRAPGRRTRRGGRAGDKWSSYSLVPHPRPTDRYRVSLPRAFVIAFVRRHSARTWRPAGERERTETEEALHAARDDHRSGFRTRFRLPLAAPLGHTRVMQRGGVVTTRPSRARAGSGSGSGSFRARGRLAVAGRGKNGRRELIMAPLRRIHSAPVWACFLPCSRSAGTSARPRCC